jgi:hypothetical protein
MQQARTHPETLSRWQGQDSLTCTRHESAAQQHAFDKLSVSESISKSICKRRKRSLSDGHVLTNEG